MDRRPADPVLSRRDVVIRGHCIGCGACSADPGAPGLRFDRYGQYTPDRQSPRYRERTAVLARTCPFSPYALNEDDLAAVLYPDARHRSAAAGRYESAYVGHVAESAFREVGSSGGMVSWVACELLRRGLVDGIAHVAETEAGGHPYFRYRISRTEQEVRAGAKSRYYPVELSAALREIRAVPGRYAVVGVPCFIKAVHLVRRQEPLFAKRIAFTLGLFCGHMKSARFVESFAWQMEASEDEVERVEFRLKDPDRPANWYRAEIGLAGGGSRQKDWWHLADGDWGAGFFQNSACNACDDVVAETADVSFGDAWVEPYSSDGRGTNVVVSRSGVVDAFLREAVADGRLELREVDSGFVEATQAAGLRHRREGLAYRRTWKSNLPKRAFPMSDLPMRRKLIYRSRSAISFWSHRMFYLARLLRWPGLYIAWARAALGLYQGLTYSRGRVGTILDRAEAFAVRLGIAVPQEVRKNNAR